MHSEEELTSQIRQQQESPEDVFEIATRATVQLFSDWFSGQKGKTISLNGLQLRGDRNY